MLLRLALDLDLSQTSSLPVSLPVALDLDLTPSSYWGSVQEAEQQFPQYQARKEKLRKTLEQLVLRDEEESEYTHTNTVSFYANHHPDIFGADLTDNDTSAVNTPRRYSHTQPYNIAHLLTTPRTCLQYPAQVLPHTPFNPTKSTNCDNGVKRRRQDTRHKGEGSQGRAERSRDQHTRHRSLDTHHQHTGERWS